MTETSGPAVFLDRDGTIVEDVDFLRRVDQIALLPGAAEGIAAIREAGLRIVVVSNQSGLARGLMTEKAVREIEAEIERRLRERAGPAAEVDAFYFCPHGPDDGCPCRKPLPGLFLRAAADLGLDLAASFAAGDMPRDLEAARAAGVRGGTVWLRSARPGAPPPPGLADAECADLREAATWILERLSSSTVRSET